MMMLTMIKTAHRYCDLPDCPWHEPRPNCSMRRGPKNYDDDEEENAEDDEDDEDIEEDDDEDDG